MFVIVSILLFFVLGMMFHYGGKIKRSQADQSTKKNLDSIKISETYQNYIQSCVEEVAKEAIFLAGRQAGRIYDYQAEGGVEYLGPPYFTYGKYILPLKRDRVVYNVSYGIINSINDDFHPEAPMYPYGLTKLVPDPAKQFNPSFVNPFGNYPSPGPFPPLCDYNGRNSPKLEGMTHSCETYDSKKTFVHKSVQEFIEAFVLNRSYSCVDPEVLPSLKNVTISNYSNNVTVLMSNENIHVSVNFPIVIQSNNVNSKSDIGLFEVNIRNRLKLIHELASHLIDEDVNNIFFDIVKDAGKLKKCKAWPGTSSTCLKQGMVVSKERNVCKDNDGTICGEEGNYDDILIITDNDFKLYGVPYEFYFAIENRPPALDLITEQAGTLGYGYDVVTFIGGKISFDPFAFDPDEDFHGDGEFMKHFYKYSLWKESYDEKYNRVYCERHMQECLSNPFNSTLKITHKKPRKWTNSSDYVETNRNASYVTTNEDRGAHNVKIEVCDDEGLCDYQIVRVFVGVASLDKSTNYYADIDNKYASLEDPYKIIFPSLSNYQTPSVYEFLMYNPEGDLIWKEEKVDVFFDIPQYSGLIPPISSEVREYFKNGVGDYNVRFIAKNSQGDTIWDSGINDGLTIKVQECLPHRSDDSVYPFTEETVFQGDHSCCIGDPDNPEEEDWGTYKTSRSSCYSRTEYGCRASENFTTPVGISARPNYVGEPPTATADDLSNDVYRRVLKAFCSGSDGNICGPRGSDTRIWLQNCTECQSCTFGSRWCTNSPSFENICNPEPKCSEGQFGKYDSGPGDGFMCQASCNLGKCGAAVNCNCSVECGAACNEGDFYWNGNTCTSHCTYATDCNFAKTENTVCPAPERIDEVIDTTIFGKNIKLKVGYNSTNPNAQVKYNGTGEYAFYASTCMQGGICLTSICTGDGVEERSGDRCYAAGVKSGAYCFVNPGPSCDIYGKCLNRRIKPQNPDGDKCYYSFDCNEENIVDGWEYEEDSDKPAEGFWEDGERCFYGDAFCNTNTGWTKPSEVKPATCPTGEPICTSSGWICS